MSRPARAGRSAAVVLTALDRVATAVFSALYCMGSAYTCSPVAPSVVLQELRLECAARRGIRDLQCLLQDAASVPH